MKKSFIFGIIIALSIILYGIITLPVLISMIPVVGIAVGVVYLFMLIIKMCE